MDRENGFGQCLRDVSSFVSRLSVRVSNTKETAEIQRDVGGRTSPLFGLERNLLAFVSIGPDVDTDVGHPFAALLVL